MNTETTATAVAAIAPVNRSQAPTSESEERMEKLSSCWGPIWRCARSNIRTSSLACSNTVGSIALAAY